jgi:AraC-like DNA-binding protein
MTESSFSDIHETDVEEAAAHLPHSMYLDHSPGSRFAFHRHAVSRGALSVEETRCTDGVHFHLADQPDYAVGLPVRGPMHADYQGQELDLGPGRAAVFGPIADAAVATGDLFDVVLVHIEPVALEDALETLLGSPPRRPLPLPTTMTLNTEAGRALAASIGLVAHDAPGTDSVLDNPMSAEPLQYRLLVQLLYATDHRDREALDGSVPTWGPHAVQRCVDLIEAHPEWPLTLADLAARAGLSVRALQGSWLRHRDGPPGYDIEQVRLDRAHHDLDSHRPGETTVAEVAASWGFRTQPFVAAYGARFGHSPAQTLRGPAYA